MERVVRSTKGLHSLADAVLLNPYEAGHSQGSAPFAVANGLAFTRPAQLGHELARAPVRPSL
jgi:hypothetical protein